MARHNRSRTRNNGTRARNHGTTGNRATERPVSFLRAPFIANHSTIRSVGFRIIDTTARKDVTRQILRATKGHPQPYVQSSRPDWTGKERDESATATNIFIHDHTAESWMEMAQQRLCCRAMKETREWCTMVVRAMYAHDNPFFKALAYCSVPSCVFQAGCPEGGAGCGWYGHTFGSGLAAYGIMTRRTVYKELFEHGLIEGSYAIDVDDAGEVNTEK